MMFRCLLMLVAWTSKAYHSFLLFDFVTRSIIFFYVMDYIYDRVI